MPACLKFFITVLMVSLGLSGCGELPVIRLPDPIFHLPGSDEPEESVNEPAANHSDKTQTSDLWERARKNFRLKHYSQKEEVKKQIAWFMKREDYLERVVTRATPFLHYILEMIESRGLPAEIALLPITESAYNPLADSPAAAAGLWQIIPLTAKNLGLRQSWWYDGRRDVHASTTAALNYLEYLHKFFKGDWELAFAAYNAGEGNVQRSLERNRKKGLPTDFWSLKLPKETTAYVPNILALAAIVENPTKFGLRLKTVGNQKKLVKVDTHSQIDISIAAKMANLKVDTIYQFNPGFFRWATDPDGPHYLLLPKENAAFFQKKLGVYESHERLEWQPYRVRSGETLLSIANKFHGLPEQIRVKNKLAAGGLKPGRTILVPRVSKVPSHIPMPRVLPQAAREKTVKERNVVVKKGDTLQKLSKKYGVSVQNLIEWNGLTLKSRLAPGKKLKLYKVKQSSRKKVSPSKRKKKSKKR